MGAFLSSQDMKMVQQEGNDTNCFVSLVVDTPGNYVAIVTRKVQTKSEVTIKKLGTSYEFFGEGSKSLTHDGSETTKTVDKEVIEYFDLEVERHEVPNSLEYLDDRFEEIEKKKSTSKSSVPWGDINKENMENKSFLEVLHQYNKKDTSKELSLFGNDSIKLEDIQWQPDPNEIHTAVVHIITLNLILNPKKIDLKQWIMRHMTNVYKKVFGESSMTECKLDSCGAFTEYRDFIIQFTLDYFNYDTVPDALMENDFDYVQGMVAQALLNEIFEYVDVNPYMKSYYETLSRYIV